MKMDPLWIQAISTVVLAVITIVYVFLTHKLVHVKFKALLKPTSFGLEQKHGKLFTMQLKNFGPGVATHIQIKALVSLKWDSSLEKYWSTIKNINPEGPFALEASEQAEYSFDEMIHLHYPILLKWKSINAKKQKSCWYIGKGDQFIPLNLLSRIRFSLKWKFSWFFKGKNSPFYDTRKLWRKKTVL